MDNGDMPATPIAVAKGPDGDFVTSDDYGTGWGLSKREHFAGLAMQGLCTSQDEGGEWRGDPVTAATLSVEYADALLKALENK